MRTLEVRRHSLTKKGAGRGRGSHLSREGVALARRLGAEMGAFDLVVASKVPRTLETALAMGHAVDDLMPELGPEDAALFAEVGHHERWGWVDPLPVFADLVRQGGATARLGEVQAATWRAVLARVPEGGRALAISHGRVIEAGLVACFPEYDFAGSGPALRQCEGVRLHEQDGRFVAFEWLRVAEWDAMGG